MESSDLFVFVFVVKNKVWVGRRWAEAWVRNSKAGHVLGSVEFSLLSDISISIPCSFRKTGDKYGHIGKLPETSTYLAWNSSGAILRCVASHCVRDSYYLCVVRFVCVHFILSFPVSDFFFDVEATGPWCLKTRLKLNCLNLSLKF
jgi:hypothetical protein